MNNNNTLSDLIVDLPIDIHNNKLSNQDSILLNTYFEKNKSFLSIISSSFKEVSLYGILFFILSLPLIDSYIKTYIPISNSSPHYLLLTKTLIFIILCFIIKNIDDIRK